MDILRDWEAKRAGGRITIYATNADTGAAVRIAGIDTIKAGKRGLMGSRGLPVATHKDGQQYQLA